MATMVGLYDDVEHAQRFVTDLVGAGIARDAISVIAPGMHASDEAADNGALGLLDGFGAHNIQGIGSVVAAGSLTSQLNEAGGMLAALTGMGVVNDQARSFAEGVRRGGTLVVVQADNVPVVMVENFLASSGAVNMNERGAQWRESGWEQFDPDAQPYEPVESAEHHDGIPDETELAPEENVGTSIGALTGGIIPGGYGAAADAIFGLDEKRRDQR